MKDDSRHDDRNLDEEILDEVNAKRMTGPVYTAGRGDHTRIIGPGGYACVHLDDEARDGWTVWDRYDPFAIQGSPRILARGVTFDEAVVICAVAR